MGKEYSTANYKKTYGENYVRSYGDRHKIKKIYNEGVKSYKEITQKKVTYNQNEKSEYDGIEADTTSVIDILEKTNKRSVTSNSNIQKNEEAKIYIQNQLNTIISSLPSSNVTPIKAVTPPPYIRPKEEKKVTRNYEIYRKLVIPPIEPIGNKMYREADKKEIVDEQEARKILSYADYSPKAQLNLIIFFIVALIGGIFFSLLGPIIIIVWGVLMKGKSTTLYQKKLEIGNLSVAMPATEQEEADYKKRGNLYICVAIVMGIIQVLRLIFLMNI